jgi:hypothetical protein
MSTNYTFTKDQIENFNKLNELLQTSSESLTCGPGTECAKLKNTNELYQNYVEAQTNVKKAPYDLNHAEKEYYTYVEGPAAYNDILDKKINEKMNKMVETMNEEFHKNIKNAMRLNDTLKTSTINYSYVAELHKNYIRANNELKNKILSKDEDIVTNDRKTYYENQNYDVLLYWYKIWFGIYFALIFVFILGILLIKSSFPNWKKLGLLFLFIIYPFIIDPIILYIIHLLKSINSLLPKSVYTTL